MGDPGVDVMAAPAAAAVLYSFRRCPFAIRARLALAAAGWLPGRDLELREVALAAKPPELLEASPRGTVPALVTAEGAVLSESLAIMCWALERADPLGWLASWDGTAQQAMQALIEENDGRFKHHLDRYRYPERYAVDPLIAGFERDGNGPEPSVNHRREALAILRDWDRRLQPGGWLLGDRPSLADWALLPFVRQFGLTEPPGWAAAAGLQALQGWLDRYVASPVLAAVMAAPWGLRRSWRSPRWIYHLAQADDWHAARVAGEYRRSSRGLTLEQVGFIHASYAHQIAATHQRFYSDAGPLKLLVLDPQRLAALGVPLRPEPAPGSGELFPHVYGALPLEAVLQVEVYP
jgi:glutathione S-transferase